MSANIIWKVVDYHEQKDFKNFNLLHYDFITFFKFNTYKVNSK